MVEITHRVGINAPCERIYELITTNNGLSKWWTNDVSGAEGVGSTIAFRFNGGGPDFKVTELIPHKKVVWTHSGSVPEAWMGTKIRWDLVQEEEQTFVRFTHYDWESTSDFMAHCSTKWAVFMLSLKDYAETGVGRAFPNDIQIDHS